MKNLFLLVLLVILFNPLISAQEIAVVDFTQLQPLLDKRNDTTYVVNFWATWCLPCIKEMPYFQQIHENFSDRKVKVILVSLDFEKQIKSRLIPFIEKNRLTAEVILLNDPDANSWIDKVNPKWSGALPATVIYNKNFQGFYEQSFTYNELEQIINQNILN
ncbi:MAG: hypothetical protein FD170_1977 [Bacteroidetes bacterium]|nr:MAG: hypothetical protein FD170_1977 [Bacteroidota bacterium]